MWTLAIYQPFITADIKRLKLISIIKLFKINAFPYQMKAI